MGKKMIEICLKKRVGRYLALNTVKNVFIILTAARVLPLETAIDDELFSPYRLGAVQTDGKNTFLCH